LQYAAAPVTAVATAAPDFSAEACKWLDWRLTPSRLVPTPSQPQEFTLSAAVTTTASLFARNGHNYGGWRGVIQAALATFNGCIVMAVSKVAAATAAAAIPTVAAAMAAASADVPVVVSKAASRRLAAASATVSGLSVVAAALPVTDGQDHLHVGHPRWGMRPPL